MELQPMNGPNLALKIAILGLTLASIAPASSAQNRGAFVAGINYPAGPPTVPTNTGFYIGGVAPVDSKTGDFNGDGRPDLVVAANCGNFAQCTNGTGVAVYLSNGDGTFQAPTLTGAALLPTIRALTVGDFNNDGKLDVAVAADCLSSQDCSAGTVSILLGNGDGTFIQSSQYPINGIVSQANTLAVGDLNGDKNLDLVVGIACYNIQVSGCSVGSVSIFPGNGDGTLGSPTSYTTVGNAALIPVVGRFNNNNDTNLDIIAGSPYAPNNTGLSSLTVLIGKGDGTFTETVTAYNFLSPLNAIAVADFNSDGRLDLAISTFGTSLEIVNGNGDGTFQSPVNYSTALNYAAVDNAAVSAIDLNHDGKPDLVVGGFLAGLNGVQLFLNDGSGNFGNGPTYGLGGWEFAFVNTDDFNGDGSVDIALVSTCSESSASTCPDGTVSMLLGNGDGTFQGAKILNQNPIFSQSNSTISADISGDGIPDLIQTSFYFSNEDHNQGGVFVSLGFGNGNYGPPTIYPTGSPNAFWVAAGDFNGDGKIDLAVANDCVDTNCTQGGVAILLGNGDGTFQSPTVYGSGGESALMLVTGDFNEDGKLDVAVMNQVQSPSIGILVGNGDGTLQPVVVTDTSAEISSNYSIAAGDFNRDGKADVALASSSTDQTTGLIRIYRSNGNGTLTLLNTYSSGGTANGGGIGFNGLSIAVGDVNRDGNLDVIIANGCRLNDANCAYGSISVLLGNGDGSFLSGSLQTVPDGNFYSLQLADINGDGILDAIAANLTGVAVFPGKPDGSFLAPTVYASVTGTRNNSLALADLNIVQTGLSSGLTAILVNKAGTYLVTTSSANPLATGQTVTLTTTVSGSYLTGITPTGDVTYFDGATNLGSAPVVAGSASFNITGLTTGVHTIISSYSGDSNFNAHAATPTLQVVVASAQTPQTITFTLSPSTVTYGTSPITLNATASSGLPVTFTAISGPGTVSGNTLTVTGAGSIVIEVNQAGNSTYSAAPPVQQSLTVNQATPTISINDIPTNAVYGESFPPTYAYTGDGTLSVTSSTTATCAVSGGTVNFVGVGTCTLIAHSTATTNYAAATGSPQSFTIAQARPTITINNILGHAQYGENFTPTYAYSGDGTTSVTSSTTATCTVSGALVTFVGLGTCTLTAHSTATVNSAAATGSPQSFSISQATPTISISNIPTNAVYGGTFTPTYAYTGNGKTSATSSTSTTCTVSNKGVVTFVGGGTCTLIAHSTATTNYTAAAGSPQSFTIARAMTVISIKNIPNSAKKGGSFMPTYNYIGDGTPSTTSSTSTTCTVSGAVVQFVASGTCRLTAQATAGTNYAATTGSSQSFAIK